MDATSPTPIFVGAHDITHRQAARLKNPEYRKKYELNYRKDLKRYKEELTLGRANTILLMKHRDRPLMLKLKKLAQSKGSNDKLSGREALLMQLVSQLPQKPFPKDTLLKLERYLLEPEDVDGDIVVENPSELGDIAQVLYAEKLPTVRLWIHYKNYMVGGTPDGVADDYVYEFKATTQVGRRVEGIEKRAYDQGQLYAYAFKRPNIKVQTAHFQLSSNSFPLTVRNLPKPDMATSSKSASEDEALAILDEFDRVFRPLPPM